MSARQQADYKNLNGKSIEKFLDRQNYARRLKEDKEMHEQKIFSNGRNWTPDVTVPLMPNIRGS